MMVSVNAVLDNGARQCDNKCTIGWGKYKIMVGENSRIGTLDQWAVQFPDRKATGASIIIADGDFHINRGNGPEICAKKALVSNNDITYLTLDGPEAFAIKIEIGDKFGVCEGYPNASFDGKLDFSDSGVPLKVSFYNFPRKLAAAALLLAQQRNPAIRIMENERIELNATANPRLLVAHGQCLDICGHDLFDGMLFVALPETQRVLNISRRPQIRKDGIYTSFGTVVVLEDLAPNNGDMGFLKN